MIYLEQTFFRREQQQYNDSVEDTASEASKEEDPDTDQECQGNRRSKTVSETSIESSYSQEPDTEELTMAELELLKKLEEANRLRLEIV